MRYLYLLFFCFLSLHSYLVFAQAESPASCQSFSGTQWCTASTTRSCTPPNQPVKVNVCAQGGNSGNLMQCANNCQCRDGKSLIDGVCKCPAGTQWHPLPAQGTSAGVCEPITCPEGQTQTVISGGPDGNQSICADIPDGGGEEPPPETCPEGRPKVNGMCPVCPEGYNEDGTCNYPSSEPASSAPNSSSPDTGSSGSAGSAGSAGGGDDGGGTPGGGGGDGDNGGNNNGGGSASSASSGSGTNNSWNPYAGYGNWIPVAEDSNCPNKYRDMSGQWWCAGGASNTSSGNTGSAGSAASAAALECDSTSSDYFSCINQKSVGGGAGWNPHQSYGGWLPINEDSPCVNKFQDKAGDWWCAAPSGGGGGGGTPASSAGSSGSSGSDGASGSEGSASSKSSTSSSHSSCASASAAPNGSSASNPCSGGGNGSASSSGSVSSLGEKGEFDGEASEKRLEELGEELTEKIDEIKLEIQN